LTNKRIIFVEKWRRKGNPTGKDDRGKDDTEEGDVEGRSRPGRRDNAKDAERR